MWNTIVPTLVGGGLAIIGGFAGIMLTTIVERRNKRKSVAGALGGEIGALIAIIERRRYLEVIDELIAEGEETGARTAFGLVARQEYFVVFNAHASELGALPPAAAQKVARFYVMAKSFLEDATDAVEDTIPIDDAHRRLCDIRELLNEILVLGRGLVAVLGTIAQ